MSTGNSFAFTGILVMLACFTVANHAVVRSVRTYTDKRARAGEPAPYRAPFGLHCIRNRVDSFRQHNEHSNCVTKLVGTIKHIFGLFMAFLFDIVQRTELGTDEFWMWRELPFSCGRWSTAVLLVATSFILSDNFLLGQLGLSFSRYIADFCSEDDFRSKLRVFRHDVHVRTNLPLARQQHNHTIEFHRALVADTKLYGEEGFHCPAIEGSSVSGKKEDWDHPLKEPFFPGYCADALDAAIRSAKTATCTEKKCACLGKKIFGKQITCCWCGEACVDVPFACPRHSGDEEAELKSFRFARLERAEQQMALLNQTLPDIEEEIKISGTETAEKILQQIDIAGTVYAYYSALALFIPSPMDIFRLPLNVIIRRYVFGVQRPAFVLFVVCMWWGAEYFQKIFFAPEFRVYVSNIIRDPCFLDGDFIAERQKIINEVCDELIPLEPEFSTYAVTINHVLEEVEFFLKSCSCPFPTRQNLRAFETPQFISADNATSIGFGRETEGLCQHPGCSILAPDPNITFLGKTTLCADTDYAASLVTAPSETDTNWWDLWLTSGLLSQILIKFVLVNFVVALYKWSDPLSSCGGRYLVPPNELYKRNDAHSEERRDKETLYEEELRLRNEQFLRAISRKWSIVWGTLSLACILNLFWATKEWNADDVTVSGKVIGAACIGVGLSSLFVSVWAVHKLTHDERNGDVRQFLEHSATAQSRDDEYTE